MKFLIDRCAGKVIADWLRAQGHDVVESRERGPDPGDRILLEWAKNESRIVVTIDTDFGQFNISREDASLRPGALAGYRGKSACASRHRYAAGIDHDTKSVEVLLKA